MKGVQAAGEREERGGGGQEGAGMEQEGAIASPQVYPMHAPGDEEWMTCFSDSPEHDTGSHSDTFSDGEMPTWEVAAMMEAETAYHHTPDSVVSSLSDDSDMAAN
eukprot:COSAG02_NODE_44619_length_364_cov_1.313208_1_plen_104_part_10